MAHNAPGRHYRKGLSLVDVFRLFPDDEAAEKWIAAVRWPDGPECPHCGSSNVQSGAKHPSMPYRCRGCRKFFSVKTGTAMADSNLGPQVWAIATYLMSTGLKGQSSMKLHRDLGVTQKTAWHLAHRTREAWADANPEPVHRPRGSRRGVLRWQGAEQAREQEAAGGPRPGREDGGRGRARLR